MEMWHSEIFEHAFSSPFWCLVYRFSAGRGVHVWRFVRSIHTLVRKSRFQCLSGMSGSRLIAPGFVVSWEPKKRHHDWLLCLGSDRTVITTG